VIAAHRAAGATFDAGGVGSFVRSQGDGETVVLVHGLPASSFLYRKVVPELAARGFRALAFDLPGLGLAERPADFDYSLQGLGAFAVAAVDALGLDRFHLVVHDAGGPVGFELASQRPHQIRSLTLLNTVVQLHDTPFPGEIVARFSLRLSGVVTSPRAWRALMRRVGILDHAAVPVAEIDAYRDLALGDDGGAGYLRIMRRLRDSAHDYRDVVHAPTVPYPVQVVWGANDPALRLKKFGWTALRATGLPTLSALPARHFLQEDQAPAIATLVAAHALAAG
jgi:haloalkane dehalogenase